MTLYVEELLEEGFGKQAMGSAVCGNSQVPRGTEYRVVTNGRAGGGRQGFISVHKISCGKEE